MFLPVRPPPFQTVTHEMGHNLGMEHDFKGKKTRKQDGVKCYGYMDYDDDTNKYLLVVSQILLLTSIGKLATFALLPLV